MSTSWYKPSMVPTLLRKFPGKFKASSNKSKEIGLDLTLTEATLPPKTSIEIWNTTCIVTNFGKSKASACSILINPANPTLTGVKKFPYFPRGGPVPKEQPKKYEHHIMGYVSQWGGMEVGTGMFFSANVVDGLVHQLGGWKLMLQCKLLPNKSNDEKCPIGHAVFTYSGGKELKEQFDKIIHTTPPFFKYHEEPEYYLAQCYRNALKLAFNNDLFTTHNQCRIASPLLGAGARGFPLDKAVQIAAEESIRWRDERISDKDSNNEERVLAFGIPDIKIAEKLIYEIEKIDTNHF